MCRAPCPPESTCGVATSASAPTHSPPKAGPAARGMPEAWTSRSTRVTPRMIRMPSGRADQAEGEARQDLHAGDVRGRDRLHVAEIDQRLRLDQRPGDEVTAERRHDHRRQRRDRIGADDQLEGIERAGQRCAESRRDGPGRAAPDQRPQVAPAHLEGDPQARGQAGGDLRVAGLQPHRGAAAVRDHVLGGEVDAVAQGHPAAVQGVRLDRVDGRALARSADVLHPDDQRTEQRPAEAGADQQEGRRHGVGRAQPQARGQEEEQLPQALGHPAHGRDCHPGDAAHQGGERHEAALAPADEAAQAARGLDDPGSRPAPAGAPPGRGAVRPAASAALPAEVCPPPAAAAGCRALTVRSPVPGPSRPANRPSAPRPRPVLRASHRSPGHRTPGQGALRRRLPGVDRPLRPPAPHRVAQFALKTAAAHDTPPASAAVAQLVRAPDCGSGGPPFEPGRWYHRISTCWMIGNRSSSTV